MRFYPPRLDRKPVAWCERQDHSQDSASTAADTEYPPWCHNGMNPRIRRGLCTPADFQILEIFQHPHVGAAVGFPDSEVFPVGRRNGPAQLHPVFFEHGANLAGSIDV